MDFIRQRTLKAAECFFPQRSSKYSKLHTNIYHYQTMPHFKCGIVVYRGGSDVWTYVTDVFLFIMHGYIAETLDIEYNIVCPQ